MLRRCLESPNPRFGMIMSPKSGSPQSDYGTMLEIRSVQMLPDGRSVVQTWGSSRFRILERGSLDGYMVGRIERYISSLLKNSNMNFLQDWWFPRWCHRFPLCRWIGWGFRSFTVSYSTATGQNALPPNNAFSKSAFINNSWRPVYRHTCPAPTINQRRPDEYLQNLSRPPPTRRRSLGRPASFLHLRQDAYRPCPVLFLGRACASAWRARKGQVVAYQECEDETCAGCSLDSGVE